MNVPEFSDREKAVASVVAGVAFAVGLWIGLWSVPDAALSVPTDLTTGTRTYTPVPGVVPVLSFGAVLVGAWGARLSLRDDPDDRCPRCGVLAEEESNCYRCPACDLRFVPGDAA